MRASLPQPWPPPSPIPGTQEGRLQTQLGWEAGQDHPKVEFKSRRREGDRPPSLPSTLGQGPCVLTHSGLENEPPDAPYRAALCHLLAGPQEGDGEAPSESHLSNDGVCRGPFWKLTLSQVPAGHASGSGRGLDDIMLGAKVQ